MTVVTPGIQFEGVSKKFHRGEVHDSLRDLIPALARRLVGKSPAAPELTRDEFWALRDVSFTVEPGQTLGVIGKNGAGKSTMLKILTRILRPTKGRYVVRGRIGALLEVAAGFHQDLTGRENIFLQGAIMGMTRRETLRKIDEIIAFSEIELFIDTPVKRYSSGMNARLGFAVAAHLDPDVLIIDEALAVGDYSFQRKAFGRVRSLATSGLPVVVVSHQLDRISELCTHAMLLSVGECIAYGAPAEVIGAYMRDAGTRVDGSSSDAPVTLHDATLLSGDGVSSGDQIRLRVAGVLHRTLPHHVEPIGLSIWSAQNGEMVFETGASMFALALEPGPFVVDIELQMNVQPGVYLLDFEVWNRSTQQRLASGPRLSVHVTPRDAFYGPTNLNAQMSLVSSPSVLHGRTARPGELPLVREFP